MYKFRKADISEIDELVRIDTHEKNTAMRHSFAGAGFTECGIVQLSNIAGEPGRRVAYEKLL